MAKKVRVHELAKDLGMSNEDMINLLKAEGIVVSSHLAGLEDDIAELIRDQVLESRKPVVELIPVDDEDDEIVALVGLDEEDRAKRRKKAKPREEEEQKIAEKKLPTKLKPATAGNRGPGGVLEVHLKAPYVVKDLAEALDVKPNTLIQELMKQGVFASINQSLDITVVEKLCAAHNATLVSDKRDKSTGITSEEDVAPEDIKFEDAGTEPRPPVVTFLGHVDHGKTSLQDAIRKTAVTSGEAGGITQHIGASNIEWRGHKITFIDTPGHEAFTAMRARGASTTDMAILVVAGDDGFMPQTVEALNHARAAKVPVIVAINKMDLPAADPDRVLLHMQQNSLTPEDWGGDVGVVKVSAMTGMGLDTLLERIILEAEILELKCNPALPGRAVVIESQLEQGLGPTVNVLVKNGTIKVGDPIICGHEFGKVKALIDTRGQRVKSAGPSMPVMVVGLNGVPDGGSILAVCSDEKLVKRLAENREMSRRSERLGPVRQVSLEDLFKQIAEDARQDLHLVIKSDVQGTGQAVKESLLKLNGPKIEIDIVHLGVGAITENDVLLAAASNAILIGFHVRVNPGVNKLAKLQGVEIKLYSVIYEVVEQVREAMEGMLAPDVREEALGQAEILKVFTPSKGSKICGCSVQTGIVKVGAKARVHRDGELIYNGSISSLRRFQDDVKEVRAGFECGIRLDNFNDFDVADRIEVYEYRETKAKL